VLIDGVGDPSSRISRYVADLSASFLAEQLEELVEGGLVAAHTSPDQPAAVVVDHNRQVLVAPLVGDLVDPDAAQPRQAVHLAVDLGLDPGDDASHRSPPDP
jgi:hypothetical protein